MRQSTDRRLETGSIILHLWSRRTDCRECGRYRAMVRTKMPSAVSSMKSALYWYYMGSLRWWDTPRTEAEFCQAMMHSWEALDPIDFKPEGAVTTAFLRIGKEDLRSAAKYVRCLPYARNARPDDPLIVPTEERGTCSTKHALLRRLAIEQTLDVALVLGIYEMAEQNTPGVGDILRKYELVSLPEAHCYLRMAGRRIDVTRAVDQVPSAAISRFLQEEDIEPAQITDYKIALHKQFLLKWIAENGGFGGRSLADLWKIREECIARLSGYSQRV
jgi:hypothetical protein